MRASERHASLHSGMVSPPKSERDRDANVLQVIKIAHEAYGGSTYANHRDDNDGISGEVNDVGNQRKE
ncbi:hypothetical protein EVAR_76081_1 [Eumeta japonica]|uniref:Uncharacterized protein n=1 Tax=Eumeta variegata TaxID=151549 RepID=A0A4C1W2P9_EUMVA|nr:hypothetical protein EVAR_76081_1 [Eumeta japonica]